MQVNRRVLLLAAAAASVNIRAGILAEPVAAQMPLKHPDGRSTEYRVVIGNRGGRLPVVLFSHGANSSNRDYDRLWYPWAARGYVVIGANHIDSGPPAEQRHVGRSELWLARVADTTLPLRQREAFDALARAHGARLDWNSLCAAGHSYGAVVAQSLAGAGINDPDGGRFDGHVAGIKACVALSPPGALGQFIPPDAWAGVHVPSLLQTGDRDVLPGFVDDWQLRLVGFSGVRDRWTLIGRGVDHYFGGLICRRSPGATAQLAALEQTADLSGDFLDAYVSGRPRALRALRARAARGDDGVLTFEAAAAGS